MASVLNRTTKEFRGSVNTPDYDPDYDPADWIINPDLSAVSGEPNKYWIIDPPGSDTVRLATLAEQAVIDAAINNATTQRDRTASSGAADDPGAVGMQNRSLIEVFNQRDNYVINRIEQLQTAMDDMKASTGAADSIRDAIPAVFLPTTTRPRNDAVQAYKDEIDSGGADN
jgi:hypothetical protein